MALVMALAFLGTVPVVAEAQNVDESFYVTNGTVSAEALLGHTLYIAGTFSQVGPATGGGVALDASSGALISVFPKVSGYVYTMIADGSGGWYIGGSFRAVGGVARHNIAHILADNSVSSWDPNADAEVACLTLDGSTLYVGGAFANIGGQPRAGIAALDLATGLASAWDPHAGGSYREVMSIVVSGPTVYACGIFQSLGHRRRYGIAALDAVTGMATDWDPMCNSPGCYAMALNGGVVYVGGNYGNIGGQARNGIAALDAATGLALAWNPNPLGGPVTGLAISGTTIYVEGGFAEIGGQARNGLAELDLASGLATGWDPNPDFGTTGGLGGFIAVNGATVYAGGSFTHIGGEPRNGLAALDRTTGLATDWNPNPNSVALAIAVKGSTVYAGGYFSSVGGQTRHGLAALNTRTGRLTSWNPDPDISAFGNLYALAASGRTVYVAGPFAHIGGQARTRFAALDAETGIATGWNANAEGGVNGNGNDALVVSGNTVYAAGDFDHIGGQARNGIAALDATTGLATGWDPNPAIEGGGPTIFAVAVRGSTVYVGGFFSSIGGQQRNAIAAIDAATGLATPWNPNPGRSVGTPSVSAIAVSGMTVYAGGDFNSIGGQNRDDIAALDASTGLATSWNPGATTAYANVDAVRAFVPRGSTVYVGGDFISIGGEVRNGLAALDANTGSALAWNPAPANTQDYPGDVTALEVGGGTVYASGEFTIVDGQPNSFLAAIETPNSPADVSHVALKASALDQTSTGPVAAVTLSIAGSLGSDPTLEYTLPAETHVRLALFDVAGRLAKTLENSRQSAGVHLVSLNRASLAHGVYFCRLEAGPVVVTKTLVLR